jgi:hypothetical protein
MIDKNWEDKLLVKLANPLVHFVVVVCSIENISMLYDLHNVETLEKC